MRSSLKFYPVNEDTIDMDRDLAKIKKRLMQKYHKVFKDQLDKNNCLKIDTIKLELVYNYEEIHPTNHMIPFPTPCHLQDAADKELDKLLKAGVLEPVEHATDCCSCGFFVHENTQGKEAKACLVCDLRG